MESSSTLSWSNSVLIWGRLRAITLAFFFGSGNWINDKKYKNVERGMLFVTEQFSTCPIVVKRYRVSFTGHQCIVVSLEEAGGGLRRGHFGLFYWGGHPSRRGRRRQDFVRGGSIKLKRPHEVGVMAISCNKPYYSRIYILRYVYLQNCWLRHYSTQSKVIKSKNKNENSKLSTLLDVGVRISVTLIIFVFL